MSHSRPTVSYSQLSQEVSSLQLAHQVHLTTIQLTTAPTLCLQDVVLCLGRKLVHVGTFGTADKDVVIDHTGKQRGRNQRQNILVTVLKRDGSITLSFPPNVNGSRTTCPLTLRVVAGSNSSPE